MQRKIEQLVSGQARKLASPEHPLHFLLYSSNKHLQEDSKYVDLQVGKQVWFNVPRRMRQELWLSVLHKHRGAGAVAAKKYATLVCQVGLTCGKISGNFSDAFMATPKQHPNSLP